MHLRRLGGDNNLCLHGRVGTVRVVNRQLSLYDQIMEDQFPLFTLDLEVDGSADGKRAPLTQYPDARIIVSTLPRDGARNVRISSPRTACVLLVSPR